jgi:peptide/nickel transport system permease protein
MSTVVTVARGVLGSSRRSWSLTIGLVLVGIVVVVSLLAPALSPYSATAQSAADAIQQPSAHHLLGTDQLGRDVLTRVLYGGRFALLIALVAAVLSVGIGTILGCFAAYRRGLPDDALMRVLDAVLSVPAILFLLVIVAVFGNGWVIMVMAATLVYFPAVVRVIRAAASAIVGLDFVTAARARGEGFWPIARREILPNILDVIMVEFAMRASWVVLLISSMSFLGFGANPPTPDWGLMVAENRALLAVVPMATVGPIIALAVLIIGLNLAADGFAKSRGIDRMLAGSQ